MQKLQSYLSQALSLLVVFLLLAATAASAGKLFGHRIGTQSPKAGATTETSGSTSETYAAPTDAQLNELGLSGAQLAERDSAVWTVNGQSDAVVISTARFGRDVQGFAGPVPLLVYIKADTVQRVVALPNEESPGYFGQASKLLHAWDGKSVGAAATLQVDAVSGATYSSRGILGNMQAALKAYGTAGSAWIAAPAIGWAKTGGVLAVLLFGLAVAWFGRGRRGLRLVVLTANILVLGFWTGQFVSLSLLRGWMANGIDWLGALPSVVVVGAALLLPWLGKKNYYCTWVCPYGSLQELAFHVPVRKWKAGMQLQKRLRGLRLAVLGVLLLLLWLGVGAAVLDYEPFAAFMVTSAPVATLCLAAVFVLLGLFVPRPWCQTLCPVGMLLNLAEDAPRKTPRAAQTARTHTHRLTQEKKTKL